MNLNTNLRVWYDTIPQRFPAFTKPKIVGYFSVDDQRRCIHSADNLNYLKLPEDINNLNLDLNEGYENVVRKPESCADEGISHLLEFIAYNKQKLISIGMSSQRLLDTEFICYRGLLRLIMCSPYEKRDDWSILVTKYKGNIYLCQRQTDMKKEQTKRETDQTRKMCSYGFKFEQYILTDDPTKEPDTRPPVNESEEFCCMFKSRLEQHDLLYGAEMDGILSAEKCDITSVDINTLEFVEVKVRRKETNYHQGQNFLRYNLLKWWCQSFLVAVTQIYMGVRNDAGFVKQIKILDMRTIPKMGQNYWSAAVCADFLNEFLNAVKKSVENINCPYTVFEFYWNPCTTRTITYKCYRGKNNLSFLPDWYIKDVGENSVS